MCVCVCVFRCGCTCSNVHICVCTHAQTCVLCVVHVYAQWRGCMCVGVHEPEYACVHVRVLMCRCTRSNVCMRVFVCVYTCLNVYICVLGSCVAAHAFTLIFMDARVQCQVGTAFHRACSRLAASASRAFPVYPHPQCWVYKHTPIPDFFCKGAGYISILDPMIWQVLFQLSHLLAPCPLLWFSRQGFSL